jgi:hypothetical protein
MECTLNRARIARRIVLVDNNTSECTNLIHNRVNCVHQIISAMFQNNELLKLPLIYFERNNLKMMKLLKNGSVYLLRTYLFH